MSELALEGKVPIPHPLPQFCVRAQEYACVSGLRPLTENVVLELYCSYFLQSVFLK